MSNIKVIALATIITTVYLAYIAIVGAAIAPTILLNLGLLNLLTILVVKFFFMPDSFSNSYYSRATLDENNSFISCQSQCRTNRNVLTHTTNVN
jgi:hypothetical protein